jgi:hypothetical protein
LFSSLAVSQLSSTDWFFVCAVKETNSTGNGPPTVMVNAVLV